MAIRIDHLTVPAKDRVAAARQLATLLGVPWTEQGAVGPFSQVFVSDELTIDFDQWEEPVPRHHYCFKVSQEEFDAILNRVKEAGMEYRSLPHGPTDNQVNPAFGGNLAYWGGTDEHVWEILTVSYERRNAAPEVGDA
jgi:hypothetical protein